MTTEPTGPIWEAAKRETNWLIYALVPHHDPEKKPRKVPMLDGKAVSPEQAAVYDYDTARAETQRLSTKKLGIGYLPREGSAMVGIDLDRVLDADGAILEEYEPFLTDETWTEVSPSGTGVRILTGREGWPAVNLDDGLTQVGLLATGQRFFTVSLDRFDDQTPLEVADAPRLRELVLAALAERMREAEEIRVRASGSGGWFDSLSTGAQEEVAAAILDALPVEQWRDTYEGWRDVTFALRAYPHLFGLWDAWSQSSPSYDASGNLAIWNGRERREGQTVFTMGSLIHHAKEAGLDVTRWSQAGTAQGSAQRLQRLAQRLQTVPGGEEMLEEAATLGEQHAAAQADAEAEREIWQRNLVAYVPSISARDARWMVLSVPSTLSGTVANMWSNAGVDNHLRQRGFAQGLLNTDAQRTSQPPIIDPRLPYGFTDMGDGLGVVNKCLLRMPVLAADPTHPAVILFERLLERVNPVPEERDWFRLWLANKVQKPWERQVGVVNVTGTHGTGRGTMFMIVRALFGGAPNVRSIGMDQIAGNTAQWTQWLEALLVTVDEADPAEEVGLARRATSSRKAYAVLKDYVDPGVKYVTVNIKGGATYEAQSFTSFLIASNSEDALPISDADRRFTILQGNRERAPEEFYAPYEALARDEAGLDAIWAYLQDIDVSQFRADRALKTEARGAMIEAGKSDLDVELEGLLADAAWPPYVTTQMLMRLMENHSDAAKRAAREGYLKGMVDRWTRDNTVALPGRTEGDTGAFRTSVKGYGQMRVRVLKRGLTDALMRAATEEVQVALDAFAEDVASPPGRPMTATRRLKVRGV